MKDQEIIEVNAEIESIDNRIKNIERIASTIETVTEKGFELWAEHLKHEEEKQKYELELENQKHLREIELENSIHKRSVYIISSTIFCVVVLVFTAMILGHNELVKTILTSSFAVGAGFGLKVAFTRNNNQQKQPIN